MNKKKIWIVSELFYPNDSATAHILTKIAHKLTEKFEVNVICSDVNYEKDIKRITDEKKDVETFNIQKIKTINIDKNNLILRLVRFILVSFSLFKALKQNLSEDDYVLTVTNPAIFLLFMLRIKRKKRIKYFLLVHDVFPENMIPAKLISKNNFLYRILKKQFDKAYSKADKVIVLGEDMKSIIQEKIKEHSDIIVIENWGDSNIESNYNENSSKIIVQYAGNFGRVQGLLKFLEIIKKINNPIIDFEFVGNGALKDEMFKFVNENKLKNIFVKESYSRDKQQLVLSNSNLSVVIIEKGMFGLGVPSKTYNIMASGKPILFIGDENSEIFNLVKKFNFGWSFSFDQENEIISFLNSIKIENLQEFKVKGSIARSIFENNYTEDIILTKYLENIN